MAKRDGKQKGAQGHAEGQHGDKTREAFIEGQRGRLSGRDASAEEGESQSDGHEDVNAYGQPVPGHHRLFEGREQHDEAEKNSEATRTSREANRFGKSGEDDRVGG
jgi:hypothetical protein